MKHFIVLMLATLLFTVSAPMLSGAAVNNVNTDLRTIKSPGDQKVKELLVRLDEISSMDKSNLKLSEKKGLKSEILKIKTYLKTHLGEGLYISVGAAIIIVLLLVILL